MQPENLALFLLGGTSQRNAIETTPYLQAQLSLHEAIIESFSDLKTALAGISDATAARRIATSTRQLLEQGMLATLGRVDAIRLIAAFLGCRAEDFHIGERNHSSFSWKDDVLPNFKPKGGTVWSQENLKGGIVRATLDGHLANYIFTTTHDSVIDALAENPGNTSNLPKWATEILKLDSGLHVLSNLRDTVSKSFSALSKEIHFEFLPTAGTRQRVQELAKHIDAALFGIGTLGLYVGLCDIAVTSEQPRAARAHFLALAEFSETSVQPHISGT